MKMLYRVLIATCAISGTAALGGCGGGGASSEEKQVAQRLSQWLMAWEGPNPGALGGFYRSGPEIYSYWFDGEDKDTHVSGLINGLFPNIRYFQRGSTSVETATIGSLLVGVARANFTAEAYTAVSIYGLEPEVFDWAPVGGTIRQIWVRDPLNEWVVAEEYFSKFWILGDTPTIDLLAVVPDIIDPDHTVNITGRAHARSNYWVLAIPDSWAAAPSGIDPVGVGDWGSVDYFGDMLVASEAIGGYGVYLYTEADPPTGDLMIGSNREAVVLSVVTALARSEKAQTAAMKAAKPRHTMADVLRNKRPAQAPVTRPAR